MSNVEGEEGGGRTMSATWRRTVSSMKRTTSSSGSFFSPKTKHIWLQGPVRTRLLYPGEGGWSEAYAISTE